MSEDQNNLLETLKAETKSAISGRFASPFLGTFSISWLLWNHRLIFVLFSDLAIDQRFHYIDTRLYPTAFLFLVMNIGGPLISALAYIFLLPYPTEWVHRWNLYRKQRLRDQDRRSEARRLLTEEEGVAYRTQVNELKMSLKSRGIELARASVRAAALSMTSLDRLRADDVEHAHTRYLTSQPFRLISVNTQTGTRITFEGDGTVEIEKFPGNIHWKYSERKIYLFNADDSAGNMGFVIFDAKTQDFEGNLVGFSAVRIRGMYHEVDFAR